MAPPPVIHFYEWMWGGAVLDEEMYGASLHVGSLDGITPTRSETITKAKFMRILE